MTESCCCYTRNAMPAAAKQAAAPSILTVLRPPRPSELSRQSIVIRLPRERSGHRLKLYEMM